MSTYAPAPWDGVTIAFLTDMHNGRGETVSQHPVCGQDIDYLAKYCDAIALGGDNVNWASTTPEDAAIRSWLNARTLPGIICSGNHDHANSQTYASRTGAQWATASQRPKFDRLDVGDSRVQLVAISQESMKFSEWLTPEAAATDPEQRPEVLPGRGYVITDNPSNPFDVSTGAGYLRTQLENGRPTWLVQHYPMRAHVSGSRFVPQATETLLQGIAAAYPNLIGILSGHHHANIVTNSNVGKPYSAGGRTLAGVNGPASGGADPFNDPLVATIVSYRPGRVTVRWRDLMRRSWIRSGVHGFANSFDVSCVEPI